MHESTQLQFQLLGSEAQVATLHRLALRGASIEDIADRTGLPADVIRLRLGFDAAKPPVESAAQYWIRNRSGLTQAASV